MIHLLLRAYLTSRLGLNVFHSNNCNTCTHMHTSWCCGAVYASPCALPRFLPALLPQPRLRHTKENDVVVASTANVLFWEAAPNPDVTCSTPGPLLQITLSHASPPFSSDPATPSFCPDILHHLTSSAHLLTCSHFPLSTPRCINWPISTQSLPDVCFLSLFFLFFFLVFQPVVWFSLPISKNWHVWFWL